MTVYVCDRCGAKLGLNDHQVHALVERGHGQRFGLRSTYLAGVLTGLVVAATPTVILFAAARKAGWL